MKICIFGAGSIGGLLAARMIMSGAEVWLYDREPRRRQLQSDGLQFVDLEQRTHRLTNLRLLARDDAPDFDFVFLAVKAQDITGSLDALTRFLSPDTTLVTLQNGIPWWYFQHYDGRYANTVIRSVDPYGSISASIDPRCIVGCIAYPAAEILDDGVVRHVEGLRFSFGELDGSSTPRTESLTQLLDTAGFRPLAIRDIRDETWLKALGNLSFNPVSALARMTMREIFEYQPTQDLVREMMIEAERIAIGLDAKLRVSVERRLTGAGNVGDHKTSMLQDLEAGRPLEIDGLLGAVLEIGQMLDMDSPTLSNVYALVSALNHSVLAD